MNQSHSYKTLEARTVAALQLKVAANKATGWVLDGPALEVTDFPSNKRATIRYSQAMFRSGFSPIRWVLLR